MGDGVTFLKRVCRIINMQKINEVIIMLSISLSNSLSSYLLSLYSLYSACFILLSHSTWYTLSFQSVFCQLLLLLSLLSLFVTSILSQLHLLFRCWSKPSNHCNISRKKLTSSLTMLLNNVSHLFIDRIRTIWRLL